MTVLCTLDDLDVAGKRVLVRVDLNVPMKDGAVTDFTRIDAVEPTITELADKGAKVVLLAHFGRPKGNVVPEMSLRPVAAPLSERLRRPVGFAEDCVGETAEAAVAAMAPGDVLLLENTRFHPGEEKNNATFAEQLAKLGDIYVNDAFSTAHRAHVSTEGLAHHLPAAAGRCMQAEIEALSRALSAPERPLAAVVGGAKVSSKIELLNNLVKKVDYLVIGGGMANTFLAARGVNVQASLQETDLHGTAREIEETAAAAGCTIVLPSDAAIAQELKAGAAMKTIDVKAVPEGWMILDIGPESAEAVDAVFEKARTVVWNGPMGAFEIEPFDRGTVAAAQKAANLTDKGEIMSIAGGGDTVAALSHAGVANRFSYVSTAGGAFLEWLEGKTLPGVAALAR